MSGVDPKGRRPSRGSQLLQDGLFVVMLLLLAGLSGWLAERHALRFDWTAGGQHSLAETSREVLATLDGPLEATLFALPGSVAGERGQALLERYRAAYPALLVEQVNPDLAPARVRELGISAAGELVLAYGDRHEVVRELSEQAVTGALLALAREAPRSVRFLAGHGERRVLGEANHDLGTFGQELQRSGLDLAPYSPALEGRLPDSTALLVVAGPRGAFLPGELEQLEAYVEGGGNLLWLDDPDLGRDLAGLAPRLGLRALEGVAVDAGGEAYGIGNPSFVVVGSYPDHPVTGELAEVTLFPQVRAYEIEPEHGWRVVPLLQSLPRSWVERGPLDGTIRQDPGELRGPLTLGVALTRERPEGAEQRVVVVGDGDFLANAYLGNGGNLALGLRLVNWLVADDALVSIPPRAAPDRNLALTQTETATIAFGFLVAAPLLLLALGFGTWWRRRRR